MMEKYIKIKLKEAKEGLLSHDGGPFGAVIINKDGKIISSAHNMVLSTNDSTAHAEVTAIRKACEKLKTHNLENCILICSCEPCPMCLSAIIWANIKKVYFSSTRYDAASIGFRDEMIYDFLERKNEILKLEQVPLKEAKDLLDDYKGEIY